MLGQRPTGLPESVFVHPLSFVESAAIGERTRVWNFAHVMAGTRVGADCNLGAHVFVESGAIVGNHVTVKNGISIWNGVTVEDDVFLGPHMVFTNVLKPRAFKRPTPEEFLPTLIKSGATIGAGAVILCGTTVGNFAFVAAGAVVIRDVPDHGFVAGNPAVLKGYVCRCANQIFPLSQSDRSCKLCERQNSDRQ